MMNRNRLAIACAVLACFPLAARAQTPEGRRVEIGGGIGTAASWWSAPLAGGDVRVSVPVGDRGDVEALVARAALSTDETLGFYGVQFKQPLRRFATPNFEPFVSYGGIGIFYREGDDSMVTPPFIGLVGAGLERRVHRHLSLRVEAQALMAFILPVGVRVAAGISVPIGQPRASTR